MTAIVRWTLFLSIGLPFQMVMYFLYPFFHLYWYLAVGPTENLQEVIHKDLEETPQHSKVRYCFHDNEDDHGAFSHYGFFNAFPDLGREGLVRLVPDGYFIRRASTEHTDPVTNNLVYVAPNYDDVSGDTVASWYFASLFVPKVSTERHSLNYLKYLGAVSLGGESKGWVSARCNNFGLNFCPDGAGYLGQPMAGPQFYVNSMVLASLYDEAWYYKLLFWIHWIVLGGWYWAFSPVLRSRNWSAGYVCDITMKALWYHAYIFGDRWWIRKPMEFITFKICTHQNALFLAMLGIKPSPLPKVMNPFFSQRQDAASGWDSDKIETANIWVKPAIERIYGQGVVLKMTGLLRIFHK